MYFTTDFATNKILNERTNAVTADAANAIRGVRRGVSARAARATAAAAKIISSVVICNQGISAIISLPKRPGATALCR